MFVGFICGAFACFAATVGACKRGGQLTSTCTWAPSGLHPTSPNLEPPSNWPGRNHGCNAGSCVLCKHNPNKRCMGNFARKYWVGDKLLAKCEGGILIECIDLNTGERVTEDLSDIRVEARHHGCCWPVPTQGTLLRSC